MVAQTADFSDGPALRHIEALVNPLAGSVSDTAAEQLGALLAEAGLSAHIVTPEPSEISGALEDMIARKPDLIVVLAGDGTARAAAAHCGPGGPLIAPLAGGTMNMLPHAIYGDVSWQEALRATLADPEVREIAGGEVSGHPFYVAAMLGAAAVFAPAREAARRGLVTRAWRRARAAFRRAISSRILFRLDRQRMHRARSVTLMCPLVSRALEDQEPHLEAAAVDPAGLLGALRIGAKVLMGEVAGDWRADPAVEALPVSRGIVWSRKPIPALIDGERVALGRRARFRYRPCAFHALAPRRTEVRQT